MTNFTQHTIDSAPQAAKAGLQGAQKALGFVPNLFATMAEAPVSLEAYNVGTTIFEKSSLNPVEQQVVLLTASIENNCEYCVAAHSVIAKNMVKADPAIVDALRNGTALPDAKLQALSDFTQAVIAERGFVADQAVEAFLNAGYTKANVLEVVVGVALKTISTYTNHLANTPLDAAFAPETWSASTCKVA